MLDAPSLQSGVTTSQRTRNVALFGLFGAGNLGNDRSLEAFLHFLRCAPFPVDVTCICYDEREVRERFGIKTIPIAPAAGGGMPVLNKTLLKIPNHFHNIMRAFSAARSFDAIFVPAPAFSMILSSAGRVCLIIWRSGAPPQGSQASHSASSVSERDQFFIL